MYRLLSTKLADVEQQFLSSNPIQWEQLLSIFEKAITEEKGKSDQAILDRVFSNIDKNTREGLQRQMERLTGKSVWLGVFPKSLLDSFIDEHTRLIKSVQREHVDKIGLAIKRGLREGRLQKDVTKDIQRLTGMCKRRAQLIARNAPLQYSGALTKHHQISAGIKQYRWQTSGDERVRESHRDRNNKVYAWEGPGPHPRSEVNCRCDAVPMLI